MSVSSVSHSLPVTEQVPANLDVQRLAYCPNPDLFQSDLWTRQETESKMSLHLTFLPVYFKNCNPKELCSLKININVERTVSELEHLPFDTAKVFILGVVTCVGLCHFPETFHGGTSPRFLLSCLSTWPAKHLQAKYSRVCWLMLNEAGWC